MSSTSNTKNVNSQPAIRLFFELTKQNSISFPTIESQKNMELVNQIQLITSPGTSAPDGIVITRIWFVKQKYHYIVWANKLTYAYKSPSSILNSMF